MRVSRPRQGTADSVISRSMGVAARSVRSLQVVEQVPLEQVEPRRLDVLDHLDERDGVEAGQPGVAVNERCLQQADAVPVCGLHLPQPEPPACELERPGRHVGADGLPVPRLAQQVLQEAALAASEVHGRLRPLSRSSFLDPVEPLLVEVLAARRLLGCLRRSVGGALGGVLGGPRGVLVGGSSGGPRRGVLGGPRRGPRGPRRGPRRPSGSRCAASWRTRRNVVVVPGHEDLAAGSAPAVGRSGRPSGGPW